jgi:LacI family transcriptional regulator, galactose operon repressor
MRDVAALARVGVMTVSRVVNGRGGVGPERAARVWHAIEQLDYRHNVTARNLRLTGQLTATIGVLLEDVANPPSAELLRAIEKVVSERNCLLLCASSDGSAERERALLAAFCTRRVDGLIIDPCAPDHRYLLPEVRRGIQVVFTGRPAPTVAADTVLSDNVGGARSAVAHLMAHGHTRIAFLGDLSHALAGAERYRGYQAALREGGIHEDESLVRCDVRSAQSAQRAVCELLGSARAPTAMFTSQYLLTLGTRAELASMGREWDVAHIGFDDISFASIVKPGITVVTQDPVAMGTIAAQLLLQRIRDPGGTPQTIKVPVNLIARGSGELPPPGAAKASRRRPAPVARPTLAR